MKEKSFDEKVIEIKKENKKKKIESFVNKYYDLFIDKFIESEKEYEDFMKDKDYNIINKEFEKLIKNEKNDIKTSVYGELHNSSYKINENYNKHITQIEVRRRDKINNETISFYKKAIELSKDKKAFYYCELAKFYQFRINSDIDNKREKENKEKYLEFSNKALNEAKPIEKYNYCIQLRTEDRKKNDISFYEDYLEKLDSLDKNKIIIYGYLIDICKEENNFQKMNKYKKYKENLIKRIEYNYLFELENSSDSKKLDFYSELVSLYQISNNILKKSRMAKEGKKLSYKILEVLENDKKIEIYKKLFYFITHITKYPNKKIIIEILKEIETIYTQEEIKNNFSEIFLTLSKYYIIFDKYLSQNPNYRSYDSLNRIKDIELLTDEEKANYYYLKAVKVNESMYEVSLSKRKIITQDTIIFYNLNNYFKEKLREYSSLESKLINFFNKNYYIFINPEEFHKELLNYFNSIIYNKTDMEKEEIYLEINKGSFDILTDINNIIKYCKNIDFIIKTIENYSEEEKVNNSEKLYLLALKHTKKDIDFLRIYLDLSFYYLKKENLKKANKYFIRASKYFNISRENGYYLNNLESEKLFNISKKQLTKKSKFQYYYTLIERNFDKKKNLFIQEALKYANSKSEKFLINLKLIKKSEIEAIKLHNQIVFYKADKTEEEKKLFIEFVEKLIEYEKLVLKTLNYANNNEEYIRLYELISSNYTELLILINDAKNENLLERMEQTFSYNKKPNFKIKVNIKIDSKNEWKYLILATLYSKDIFQKRSITESKEKVRKNYLKAIRISEKKNHFLYYYQLFDILQYYQKDAIIYLNKAINHSKDEYKSELYFKLSYLEKKILNKEKALRSAIKYSDKEWEQKAKEYIVFDESQYNTKLHEKDIELDKLDLNTKNSLKEELPIKFNYYKELIELYQRYQDTDDFIIKTIKEMIDIFSKKQIISFLESSFYNASFELKEFVNNELIKLNNKLYYYEKLLNIYFYEKEIEFNLEKKVETLFNKSIKNLNNEDIAKLANIISNYYGTNIVKEKEYINKAIKFADEKSDYQIKLSYIFERENKFKKAEELILKAIESSNDREKYIYYNYLAKFYIKRKKYEKADNYFEKELSFIKKYNDKYLYLSQCIKIANYFYNDKKEYSIKYWKKKLNHKEENIYFKSDYLNIIKCYEEIGDEKNREKYQKEYEELMSYYFSSTLTLANHYKEKKEYDKAIEEYKKFINIKYIEKVQNRVMQISESITYNSLNKLNQDKIIALFSLVDIYKNIKNDFKNAINSCKKIIELDKNNSKAYFLLAQIYELEDYKIYDYKKAIKNYKKAIKLDEYNYNYKEKLKTFYLKLSQQAKNSNNQKEFIIYIEKAFLLGADNIGKELLNHYKNEIKRLEREKATLQLNIMQAVSHTLGNMLYIQKGVTEGLFTSKNLDKDIKRLQLFQMMTSSVLESIKVAFGGNIDNNIEFFNNKGDNRISLECLLYFSLAINVENILTAGGDWRVRRKKLLSINSSNQKDIFLEIEKIKKNPKFQILELDDKSINSYRDFFHSTDFKILNRFFNIEIELLENVFIEKDSYTFAILFVILQELIKNMLKYGSTKDNKKIYKISIKNDKKLLLLFENSFLDGKIKNKIGTLKGLKMIEMFANVLGGYKNISDDNNFSIEIEISKRHFNKD